MLKITDSDGVKYSIYWVHDNNCTHPINTSKKGRVGFIPSSTICYLTISSPTIPEKVLETGSYVHNSTHNPMSFCKEVGRTNSLKELFRVFCFTKEQRTKLWKQYNNRHFASIHHYEATEEEAEAISEVTPGRYVFDAYDDELFVYEGKKGLFMLDIKVQTAWDYFKKFWNKLLE